MDDHHHHDYIAKFPEKTMEVPKVEWRAHNKSG
jgi:hypothetical protein